MEVNFSSRLVSFLACVVGSSEARDRCHQQCPLSAFERSTPTRMSSYIAEDNDTNTNDMVKLQEAKEYMKTKVDPIMSELLRELVVEQPEDVLSYVIKFCNSKREYTPEMQAKREEVARQFGQQIERAVTPPGKYKSKTYGGRHVSYSGTLGGGDGGGGSSSKEEGGDGNSKSEVAPPKVLTAAERRQAMLDAAEKRSQGNSNRGGKISDEKRKQMAQGRKRDQMIGKIRAMYSASGKDEPFGLGMAKMEVLEMHYNRAQGYARGHAKQSARENKLKGVRLN